MQNIENLRNLYNRYAAENQFKKYTPQELYEPLDYILALGGKQMRPVLLLMATEIFDATKIEQALAAAYAVELFHNFSLLHDDIMDDAPIRRGKPTVHEHFGTNTAILSGDVMLVYAYQYLSKVGGNGLAALLQVFNETAIGVCEGQQMDMNFENSIQVTLPEYIRMIELKTSVLLHGAMKMGAIIAGASDADAEHIAEFGRNMGIAFQLQDDYLDSFGEEASFGKRIGGDIVQNKKTFLFLKALELSNDAQRSALIGHYTQSVAAAEEPTKIEAVKAIFRASGALEAIVQEMELFRQKALYHLSMLSVSEAAKKPLLGFLDYLMQRNH